MKKDMLEREREIKKIEKERGQTMLEGRREGQKNIT